MRLSSVSFTHASTAIFGLAVACYTAVRLAGYDVPHLPGHLALPAPPIIERAPGTGQPPSRSAQRATDFVDHRTRHPDAAEELQADAAAMTPNPIARPIETAVASANRSQDAQEWREDRPTGDEPDQEQPDTAPDHDSADPVPSPGTTPSDTDDSADPADDTTADEEETSASSQDTTDSDDEPAESERS